MAGTFIHCKAGVKEEEKREGLFRKTGVRRSAVAVKNWLATEGGRRVRSDELAAAHAARAGLLLAGVLPLQAVLAASVAAVVL